MGSLAATVADVVSMDSFIRVSFDDLVSDAFLHCARDERNYLQTTCGRANCPFGIA
jgi:hypothetical protein